MTGPVDHQNIEGAPVWPRGGPDRQAARVVCYDPNGRVLLMRWNITGLPYWEPPGGGIEPDEEPLDAARRELEEETGLPGRSVLDHHITVTRDFAWFGTPCPRVEKFFAAAVPVDAPEIRPTGLASHESSWLVGHGWFYPEQIPQLNEHVEPPNLLRILAELRPGPRP